MNCRWKWYFENAATPLNTFQAQITVEMLVDVTQHPLHPGMVVFKRRLHRLLLRGDTS